MFLPLLLSFLVLPMPPCGTESEVRSIDEHWTTIRVDQTTGVDNSSCHEGIIPCKTLNMAFEVLNLEYNIEIEIACGEHTLNYGITNISTVYHVNITGCGQANDTVIKCNSSGIHVKYSHNVNIRSLTFDGCGQIIEINGHLLQFGILIESSKVSHLSDIVITNSNGTGLVLTGDCTPTIIDNSTIQNSQSSTSIINSRLPFIHGGGIVFFQVSGSFILRNTQVFNSTFRSNIVCLYEGGSVTITDSASAYITIESCSISGFVAYAMKLSNFVINKTSITSVNIRMDYKWSSSPSSQFKMTDVKMPPSRFMISYSNASESLVDYPYSEAVLSSDDFHLVYELKSMLTLTMIWHTGSTINVTLPTVINDNCHANQTSIRGICLKYRLGTTSGYRGHCPVFYSYCSSDNLLCYCDNHHQGNLCGGCSSGSSVAVNSPFLSCSCDSTSTVTKGWLALIGLEVLPITVMIILIALLNVNLNQGSLNAYILFCQLLTISFPSVGYPSWIVMKDLYSLDSSLTKFVLFPFAIWNLDFMNVFSCFKHNSDGAGFNFCISQGTTPLAVFFMWYCLALYPIVLVGVFYVCIRFYNNGYRCFVFLFRPLHRVLARFWRLFDIQPSFIHTVASIYTLCFMQLAATSLKMLHPTWYYDGNDEKILAFFYDGTQRYFTRWHIPAVFIAITVLIIVIGITVYLLLYPFQWFQCFITKIRLKNAFLVSMCDVFMGPFNEGLERKSIDMRVFAGIHFAFRLVIMTLYYIPQNDHTLFIIPVIEASLCALFVCAILVFRPYKRTIHNFIEVFLLLTLGYLSLGYFSGENLENYLTYVILTMCLVVFVMVIPYCLMWLVMKTKKAYLYLNPIMKMPTNSATDGSNTENNLLEPQRMNTIQEGGYDSKDDDTDELADRLLNPDQYHNGPFTGSSNDSTLSDRTTNRLSRSHTTYETFVQ